MGLFEVILLDTHILLWMLFEPRRLSSIAVRGIEQSREVEGLAVSSVTLFEVALVVTRKRIEINTAVERLLDDIEERFVIRPINASIAIASARFSDPYPKDPMDRLIGATALVEGIPLVTADERIRQSGQLQTIW